MMAKSLPPSQSDGYVFGIPWYAWLLGALVCWLYDALKGLL